jgi:sialate O-acetylesterase
MICEARVNLRSLLLLALLPAATLPAEVVLPKVLTSHMVVQRDLPVHVWGKAAPGEDVTVSFRGETLSIKAGELGRWSAYLKPGTAGGPFVMTVKGTKADGSAQWITLDDVLVGDVWLASGQSNMQFQMSQAATAAADLPHAGIDSMRLLTIERRTAEYPADDVESWGWKISTPESAKDFSAVAWYFAREIAQRENVPVGIIDSTWGGTVAESWVRLTALGEDASLAPLFATRGRMTDREADALLEDKRQQKLRDEAKSAGKPEPQFSWHPMLAMWGPSLIYNGMIAPLTSMPIRGVIWYQGESNSPLERAPLYHRIFRTLIEDWRNQWGEGDFPFLFTQISNFKSNATEDWATVREQQRKTLELRNTAMAVTIDIGNPDNVHPTDKVDVGHRLALTARALSYGEAVEYSGPHFRQVTTEGSSLRLWFDHARGLNFKDNKATGFEVAGADGKFVAATAKIDGANVVVSSPDVAEPLLVRYGWANSPECNLFNGDGLPASPFSSVK